MRVVTESRGLRRELGSWGVNTAKEDDQRGSSVADAVLGGG